LVQKDIGLLKKFQSIVDCGIVYGPNDKGVFSWKTTRKGEAEHIRNILGEWLSERRMGTVNKLLNKEAEQTFRPLSTKCSKGHEYNEENTRFRKDDGSRICRICAKEYAKEWRTKQ
jgi:hypothetical protein